MPTPNDYSRYDFNAQTDQQPAAPSTPPVTQDQSVMAGTYPDAFRSNLISGSEEVDRQEATTVPGDPLVLDAAKTESEKAFLDLQTFLNSNYETPGSRWPGKGQNPKLTER